MAKKAEGRALSDFKNIFLNLGLRPAEQELLDKCAKGEAATFGSATRPDRPEDRTQVNRIGADFLRFLMLGGDEYAPLHEEGVQLEGAWIEGELVLDGAVLPHDIALNNCWFDSKISLIAAQTRRIDLDGSRVTRLSGEGAEIRGDVFLRKWAARNGNRFVAQEGVNLSGAKIAGDLDCSKGVFNNRGESALNFSQAEINGNVFLHHGFIAKGSVLLIGAKIGGSFNCQRGVFRNRETTAGSESAVALGLDRATIGGGVFLNEGFRASGAVRLDGAKISGDLDCSKGTFINPCKIALAFNGAEIRGCVYLCNEFSARGAVSLIGAKVTGDIDSKKGKFRNRPTAHTRYAHSLIIERADIGGAVFLSEGFCAEGVVRLNDTRIGGNLDCRHGSFIGASVRELIEQKTPDSARIALFMNRTQVTGRFFIRELRDISGNISLAHAHVDVLFDDENLIKKFKDDSTSRFYLDGFTYNRLHSGAPVSWSDRLRWLEAQPPKLLSKNSFRPQPWNQVIKVLREMGHLEQARKLAIAKENHVYMIGKGAGYVRPFHWLYGKLAGYGHRPSWLVMWMCGIWLVCGVFYYWAASEALFGPSNPLVFNDPNLAHCAPNAPNVSIVPKPDGSWKKQQKVGNWWWCKEMRGEYTSFSPFLYSLDLILPVVSLGQAKDWGPITPSADPGIGTRPTIISMIFDLSDVFNLPAWRTGRLPNGPSTWRDHTALFVRFVTWAENLFGWAASLLMVATLSGLVKKDEA